MALANVGATKEQVENWLRRDDDKDQVMLSDINLAGFLNGLIIKNRGKKDGQLPVNEKKLNNNLILVKLKIALSLQAEDIISLLVTVEFNLGKSELSAFFRKPEHKHFRQCKDQVLRNFLMALQLKHRPKKEQNVDKTKSHDQSPQTRPSYTKKSPIGDKTQGARPSKGKIYVNPNATTTSKKPTNKTLKLKPEDIWGKKD